MPTFVVICPQSLSYAHNRSHINAHIRSHVNARIRGHIDACIRKHIKTHIQNQAKKNPNHVKAHQTHMKTQ